MGAQRKKITIISVPFGQLSYLVSRFSPLYFLYKIQTFYNILWNPKLHVDFKRQYNLTSYIQCE